MAKQYSPPCHCVTVIASLTLQAVDILASLQRQMQQSIQAAHQRQDGAGGEEAQESLREACGMRILEALPLLNQGDTVEARCEMWWYIAV